MASKYMGSGLALCVNTRSKRLLKSQTFGPTSVLS